MQRRAPKRVYSGPHVQGKGNPDTDMHGAESGFHSGGNPVHGYRRHHSRRRLSDRGKRICAEGKLFSKTGNRTDSGIPVNKGTAFCHGVPGAYIHEQGCGSAA